MTKKPTNSAPPSKSKSFLRTEGEQRLVLARRKRREAALIAKLEGILEKMEREEAKAKAQAMAEAKVYNFSLEETQALILDVVEGPLQQDNTRSAPAWLRRRRVRRLRSRGKLALELSQMLRNA